MRHPLVLAGLSFALIAIAAGCGGSSTTTSPPTVAPSVAPSSTTAAISTTSSSTSTVGAGSITAAVTIPQVQSGSGTVAITGSTSVLGTSTPFTATRRVAVSGPSTGTPLFYVEFQPSASFTVTTYPSFTFTLPSSISTSGENFYVAIYSNDPVYGTNGSWQAPVIGPATVSGQTLTLTGGSTTGAVTLSSSYYYVFCLYEATASPSPSPSSSASGNPSPSPSSSASGNPSPSPSSSASGNPSASPSSAPTTVPQTWTFGGSSAPGTFTAGTMPSAVNLVAYQGIGVSVQFAAPTSGSGTLQFSDALNNGDVSPNNLPPDSGTSGATAGYTGIIYLSTYNAGTGTISFGSAIPTITVADTSLMGTYTTCEFDVYGKQGNGTMPVWFSVGVSGTVTSNGVIVGPGTLGAGNSVDFQPGQQIIAVSCH